jgi:hypothetical protein
MLTPLAFTVDPPGPFAPGSLAWLDPVVRDTLALLMVLPAPSRAPIVGSVLGRRAGLAHTRFERLIRQLVDGGLAMARRGRTGGYSLARPAAEITLLEVFHNALPGRGLRADELGGLGGYLFDWLARHTLADLKVTPPPLDHH